MSISAQQVQLVQDSWAKVEPISETAAEIFYGRLFELDPELKKLALSGSPNVLNIPLTHADFRVYE